MHILPQTALNGFRSGIYRLVQNEGTAVFHGDIALHQGVVGELECGTALHGDIGALHGGIGPVILIRHHHMRRVGALQHHGAGLHGEATGIAVVAGE